MSFKEIALLCGALSGSVKECINTGVIRELVNEPVPITQKVVWDQDYGLVEFPPGTLSAENKGKDIEPSIKQEVWSPFLEPIADLVQNGKYIIIIPDELPNNAVVNIQWGILADNAVAEYSSDMLVYLAGNGNIPARTISEIGDNPNTWCTDPFQCYAVASQGVVGAGKFYYTELKFETEPRLPGDPVEKTRALIISSVTTEKRVTDVRPVRQSTDSKIALLPTSDIDSDEPNEKIYGTMGITGNYTEDERTFHWGDSSDLVKVDLADIADGQVIIETRRVEDLVDTAIEVFIWSETENKWILKWKNDDKYPDKCSEGIDCSSRVEVNFDEVDPNEFPNKVVVIKIINLKQASEKQLAPDKYLLVVEKSNKSFLPLILE